MATETVTVRLPKSVFIKLKQAADLTYRSVEDVLVSAINATLVETPGIPSSLANELAGMPLFSDQALWAAAKPSLSAADQERLSQLNHRAGEAALTRAERAEHERLLGAYQRSVLRRAKALAILAQRGHRVTTEADAQGDTA